MIKPEQNKFNSGYVAAPPPPKEQIVGGMTVAGLQVIKPPAPILFPNGHGWIDAVGAERGEVQANSNFDSFLCTIFSVGGAISDYLKKAYNVDMDFSECIQGVLAGITPNIGGTIHDSLESFRTKGWLDQAYRMFTESTTQAQCFAAVTDALRLMAKGKLDNYDIYYDLIEDSNDVSHQKIIDSLKISEIIVAGYAWAAYYGQQGVFDSYDYPANHCFRIGDGGNISQEVKSKFEGRGYDIDWSLVDLIAIDSYRFDWVNDPATDHENLNDFLKPLAKTYKINSAYRIYLIPKKKISFLTLFKNMQEFLWSYSDQHGVYFYFVKKINGVLNKQFMDISKLPDDLSFLKGLAIIFGEIGATRQTSWAEISTIPDHKFF